MKRFGLAAILLFAASSASAQWIKTPTAGIPRDANGKANLAAPAPRSADGHPDLSGLWQLGIEIGYAANITADLAPRDIQPWAAALSRARLEEFGKDDPEITGCKPGGPRHITRGGLTKVIQTPTLIVMLFEDLSYRQIFLDGRDLPKDPNPTWIGYSIGRWDGDTLVVDTTNFSSHGGFRGASPNLHLVEKFTRVDRDALRYEFTVDDPATWTKSWTASIPMVRTDELMFEYACHEANYALEGVLKGARYQEKQPKASK